MPRLIAVIPTNLVTNPLGLRSLLTTRVAGRTVLEHTIRRATRVPSVQAVVLTHPVGQDPRSILGHQAFGKPVVSLAEPAGAVDRYVRMRIAARKWALGAWRGGLRGMTCYDELLPAAPMVAAMESHQADAALLLGADWLLADPQLCQAVIDRHLESPQALAMTLTQAPPGLCGLVAARPLLQEAAQNSISFGQLMAYNPTRPQADPIGRDICVQLPAAVRNCTHRFVHDTPAGAAMIRHLAGVLGDRFDTADAQTITQAASGFDVTTLSGFSSLPRQITLELTPHRVVSGPLTPQHHLSIDRPDMTLDTAVRLVQQMGQDRDTVLTLGGLGDALLHEHWHDVVLAAHEAGVWGIALETDLQADRPTLERLLELPIDIVSVRLNADTEATYQRVMAPPPGHGFARVIDNLQWLLGQRNRRSAPGSPGTPGTPGTPGETTELAPGAGDSGTATATACPPATGTSRGSGGSGGAGGSGAGLPWVVPRLIKTADTLADMEGFYDRWVHWCGHAVIEPATSGCGLMPELSPVCMAPPRRVACRQLFSRMTILSDGRVARCDQDWLGGSFAGDANQVPLQEIWQSMQPLRAAHAGGRWDPLGICQSCHEWHRP